MVPVGGTLFIVPHTHWDREWYEPFQGFRRRLVRLVDDLLDLLDREPDFRAFMLDGQSVVLEDYLEVRSHQEERLRQAIRSGRILVGPWYVLPDEFLVSGESFVRNLERGAAVSAKFGLPMGIGYLPDQFGHIASMPAILQGYGLDTACLWRGVGKDIPTPVFIWKSGETRVTVIYLPLGYGNAASLPLGSETLRSALHDVSAALKPWYDRLSDAAGRAVGLSLLLMNGTDHTPAQTGLPHALATLGDTVRWEIGTLPQYADLVRKSLVAEGQSGLPAIALNLPVHDGELRSAARAPLLVGVTSVRHWIKQREWALANMLERYAEPLCAFAGALDLGSPPSAGYLDLAWKYLLLNHPHDSICGCSVDQVHRDMAYRFDQAEMIVKRLVEESGNAVSAALVRSVPAPGSTSGPMPGVSGASVANRPAVVVFNPGHSTDQTVTEVSQTGLPPDIRYLRDASGRCFPLQAAAGGAGREAVLFHPGVLPSVGFKAFWVSAQDANAGSGNRAGERVRRRRNASEILLSPRTLDNGLLRVEVTPDGSLRVTELKSGVVYPDVNRFVDGGDRGDEYNWDPPKQDVQVSGPGGRRTRKAAASNRAVRCRVEESGPVRATIRVEMTYRVPESLDSSRDARSEKLASLRIATRVSLMRGVRRVDIRTTVENTALDHRLRVHFQVPFVATKSHAGGQFRVVSRPVTRTLIPDTAPPPGGPPEWPTGTHPMRSFVDVSDGNAGLALSTKGIYEYEVIPGEDDGQSSDLALTLMRCVGWLSRPDLRLRRGNAGPKVETPEAQCLGTADFEYSLYPHRGDWLDGAVCQFAEAYQASPVYFKPAGPVTPAEGSGSVGESSLLGVDGPELLWSSVRGLEDGALLVRLYDVSGKPGRAVLRSFFPIKGAAKVDLRNLPTGEAVALKDNHAVQFDYAGLEIVTLRLETDALRPR